MSDQEARIHELERHIENLEWIIYENVRYIDMVTTLPAKAGSFSGYACAYYHPEAMAEALHGDVRRGYCRFGSGGDPARPAG